jgi:hypothetical protein
MTKVTDRGVVVVVAKSVEDNFNGGKLAATRHDDSASHGGVVELTL